MRRTLAALMVLGATACAATTTEPEFNDEAPALLEIEYTNAAWAPTWNGYYIDSSGALYSWNASERNLSTYPRDEELTHAELMQKLTARRQKVRDLSTTELQDIAELIPAAANGNLTTPQSRCADAGQLVFRAYTYDSQRGLFKPVTLRVEGDVVRKNTSGAAQEIYEYLDELGVAQHINGCQPE